MSGTSKNIHGNKTTQTHEKKKHNKNKQTNKTQQQQTQQQKHKQNHTEQVFLREESKTSRGKDNAKLKSAACVMDGVSH